MEKVTIIEYRPELADIFTRMNLAWIEKYFEIEEADREVLGDPQFNIINKGGFIFFAESGDEIAGTFALLKMPGNVYELAKMAVSEIFQGKKIGNLMLEFCINKAKQLHASKLILFSNRKLGPAIHLYKKYGFREVPLEHAEYTRSDIRMELELN